MNEKKFIELYQRQKESGLTVREFCSNEIIAPSTFYHWQKKLKSLNKLPGFIPVVINSDTDLSPFQLPEGIPIAATDGRQQNDISPIEIEFSNKTIIRIRSGLDLSMLKALIQIND